MSLWSNQNIMFLDPQDINFDENITKNKYIRLSKRHNLFTKGIYETTQLVGYNLK